MAEGVIQLIRRKQLLVDVAPALPTDLAPGVESGFDHRSLRPDLTGGLSPEFMEPQFVPNYVAWGPEAEYADLSELEDYLPGGRRNRRKHKKAKKAKKTTRKTARKTKAKRKVKTARKNVKKVKRVRKVKKVRRVCRAQNGHFKHCKKPCHKKANPGKGRFKKCKKLRKP